MGRRVRSSVRDVYDGAALHRRVGRGHRDGPARQDGESFRWAAADTRADRPQEGSDVFSVTGSQWYGYPISTGLPSRPARRHADGRDTRQRHGRHRESGFTPPWPWRRKTTFTATSTTK